MTLEEAIATRNIEETESILMSLIKIDKSNKELLVKLALTELQHPFHDADLSMHYLQEALSICPNSSELLLLLSYIQWMERGVIHEGLFQRLSFIHDDSPDTLALVRIVQSKNYMCQDEMLEMRYLKEAIRYSKKYPYSFYRLGCIFLQNGKVDQAQKFLFKAKECVKIILTPDCSPDFTSPQVFIDEHVSWTALSTVNYKDLCDQCAKAVIC